MRTPAGLRAQQTLDMLNSDWPIGPVGVGTLAAPKMVSQIQTMMEKLWWDRPFTLRGVDLKAGAATLQLTTSYGAQQEIRIHTARRHIGGRVRPHHAAPEDLVVA